MKYETSSYCYTHSLEKNGESRIIQLSRIETLLITTTSHSLSLSLSHTEHTFISYNFHSLLTHPRSVLPSIPPYSTRHYTHNTRWSTFCHTPKPTHTLPSSSVVVVLVVFLTCHTSIFIPISSTCLLFIWSLRYSQPASHFYLQSYKSKLWHALASIHGGYC